MVRGRFGPVPYRDIDDFGRYVQNTREWREESHNAGRPSGLHDFYAANGICSVCGSHGAIMVGTTEPRDSAETGIADELGVDQLPIYEVCPSCRGTGKRSSDDA